jgi:hypothetical protein
MPLRKIDLHKYSAGRQRVLVPAATNGRGGCNRGRIYAAPWGFLAPLSKIFFAEIRGFRRGNTSSFLNNRNDR